MQRVVLSATTHRRIDAPPATHHSRVEVVDS